MYLLFVLSSLFLTKAFAQSSDQICLASPTKPDVVNAKITWKDNGDGTITIRTTFAKTFVDNTYGTNAVGWPKGHTFDNLVGSDHVELSLFDASKTKRMDFKLDYISQDKTAKSGYASLGVSGGDGKMILGNASDVVSWTSSLDQNFNKFGYVLTDNSPATDATYKPNPTYPNWIYDVWYEVTVKKSAFPGGFGQPMIASVHASPSKTGNNTEEVIPVPCPCTLTCQITGDDICLQGSNGGSTIISGPAGNVTYSWTGPNGFTATTKDITVSTTGGAGTGTPGVYTLTIKTADGCTSTCSKEVKAKVCTPNVDQICLASPTKPDVVNAKITWVDNGNGTITIRTTFAKTFVDNTYGTNAIGWPKGHKFGDLVGSDHVELLLYNKAGAKQLDFKLDYISQDKTAKSGYTSLGVLGGDGKMILGNASDIVSWTTSLDQNFNNFGYVLTENSPATDASYKPNPTYPNWIYDVWYEVTVKASAFTGGFGKPMIASVHASPSKTGNNSEEVVEVPCPCTVVCQITGDDICLQGSNGGSTVLSGPTGVNYTYSWTGPNGFTASTKDIVVSTTGAAGTGAPGMYMLTVKTPDGCTSNCSRNVQAKVCTTTTNQICLASPTKPNVVNAKITWVDNGNGTITIRTTFAKTFVDNTYGTNAIGWPKGHKFGDLVGSDHVELSLYDVNKTKQLGFKLDYISQDKNAPSGYASLGVLGGDGKMITGNASDVVSWTTSLDENFNKYGYVLTDNSPATDTTYKPNPTYPNWIYDVWYEVTVKKSAFPNGFGQPMIASVHASPSKTGNNSEDVVPVPCPCTLTCDITGDDICTQGSNGGSTVLSGPTGNFTYSWTGPNGFTATTKDITVSTTGGAGTGTLGVYTLTLKNADGCTSTCTREVRLNQCSITGNTSIPSGGSTALTASGGNGATYSWTGPNGFTASTATISNLTQPGTYTVKVSYATGCFTTCSATLTTNSDICLASPTKPDVVSARLSWTNNVNGTITIRATLARTFVDNTYGVNAIGWTKGHSFGNLVGSDNLEFALYNAAGTKQLDFKLDYISQDKTAKSGYTSLGVLGGDGRMILGNASDVVSWRTSLDQNFNTYNYVLTENSPATDATYKPNPTYPNWIYDVWYEVTVKASAFTGGFGKPMIASVHASPSKTGSNTEDVVPVPCVCDIKGGPLCKPGSSAGSAVYSATDGIGYTYSWTGPNGFTASTKDITVTTETGTASIAGPGIYTLTVKTADGRSFSCTKEIAIDPNCSSTTIRSTGEPTVTESNMADFKGNLSVLAMPNPFRDKVHFVIRSKVSGQGVLEVYNMVGMKLKTVYQGYVQAGREQAFDYTPTGATKANLVYRMQVGTEQVTGKLVNAQ